MDLLWLSSKKLSSFLSVKVAYQFAPLVYHKGKKILQNVNFADDQKDFFRGNLISRIDDSFKLREIFFPYGRFFTISRSDTISELKTIDMDPWFFRKA